MLDANSADLDRLRQYIQEDYDYPRLVQQAACNQRGVLMFLRGMPDDIEMNGHTFGRHHLSSELEKRFGIKTRESFRLTPDNEERLAAYCREDAHLCNALMLLDEATLRQPKATAFAASQ